MQISPLDEKKQKRGQHGMKFTEATRFIYRTEGAKGFMRGLTPSIVKNFLTGGTYFSSLYYIEESLKRLNFLTDSQVHFSSACLARTFQSILSNPLIVIKTRLEVVGFNEYNSVFDAFSKIYRLEGIGGFWTGIKVSLIRDVPFSGIFYPIYNFCKKELQILYELTHGPLKNMSSGDRMLALGWIAG